MKCLGKQEEGGNISEQVQGVRVRCILETLLKEVTWAGPYLQSKKTPEIFQHSSLQNTPSWGFGPKTLPIKHREDKEVFSFPLLTPRQGEIGTACLMVLSPRWSHTTSTRLR